MGWFLTFKFLIALKLNLKGFYFSNKCTNLFFSKSGKSHYKILKLEVENFEHLHCKVWSWILLNILSIWFQKIAQKKSAFIQQISICSFFVQKKSGAGGMGRWMDGWIGGWAGGRAILRIAYSNQTRA